MNLVPLVDLVLAWFATTTSTVGDMSATKGPGMVTQSPILKGASSGKGGNSVTPVLTISTPSMTSLSLPDAGRSKNCRCISCIDCPAARPSSSPPSRHPWQRSARSSSPCSPAGRPEVARSSHASLGPSKLSSSASSLKNSVYGLLSSFASKRPHLRSRWPSGST